MSTSQPLWKQWSNYVNDASGVENVLRLLQSTCQVMDACATSPAAAQPWSIAWKQFNLGRRYFRYFKFIDCFETSWKLFAGRNGVSSTEKQAGGYVPLTLDICKWSTLGCYLLLEAFTILDALGIWATAWTAQTLLDGYKFWFYSIVFSILGDVWRLLFLGAPAVEEEQSNGTASSPTGPANKNKKGGKKVNEKNSVTKDKSVAAPGPAGRPSTRQLMTNVLMNGCDLLIPGWILGWLPISFLTMGLGSLLSALLVGRSRWAAIQRAKQ